MDVVSILTGITLLSAVCFIVGFILVVIEMFHPGLGAPGITGGILLVLGVIIMAQKLNLVQVLILLLLIVALLGAALAIVLQSASKGRLSRNIILHEFQEKEAGYTGTEDLNYFLGHEGNTLTILRPSGTADFNGVKLDVVSEGEFIQKDKRVKITKVEGRRIVVKEIS